MATRRSRLKVLPNLGGRNNREGNATAENKSAASVTPPKATTNGNVTKNSVKPTPEVVASSSNSSVNKTPPSKKDGLVNIERDSESQSSELNDSDEVQIIENDIPNDKKVVEEDTSTRTQSNEVSQSQTQNSEEDAENYVFKTQDRQPQDQNSAKELKTNDSTSVPNEIKLSSEVKESSVESNDTAVSEDSELQIIENPSPKEVVTEPTKKLPSRGPSRRFMKAKPNLLEAGRRNSLKVLPSNKEAEEILKPPPAIHRIASIPERITEKGVDTKGATRKNSDVDCSNGDDVEKEKSTEEIENAPSSVELTSVEPKPTNKSSRTQASSSNHQSRNRTQSKNYDKEEAITRRNTMRNKKCPPDRSKMTMFDLIYWNPTSNPMVYNDEAEAVQPVPDDKDKTEEENILAPTEEEERVDNGEDEEQPQPQQHQQEEEEENTEAESMPGPRVKIGPDGSIILDEQSLVIETTASKNNTVSDSPIVYEKSSNTTYSSFRNKRRHKNWSDKETMKFYKALSTVGTDFSLMANLFPKRSRDELKLKFKKEERCSKELVDKAVRERQQFDLSIFDDDDDDEEEEENSPTNKQIAKKILNTRRKRPKLSEDNSNIQENNSPKKPSSDVSGNPPLVKRRSRKRKVAAEESPESDKRLDQFSLNDSRGTYDALIFDIENPVKSSRKTNNKDTLNNKKVDSSPESKNEKAKENEETLDASESDSHDSEIEVLSNIRRPTRSGRQPKQRNIFTIEEKAKRQRRRAQLSASPVISTVTVTSTTGNLTSTPPTVVATQLQNILLSHPALSGLAASPDTAQNRLIFVPSSSSEQGTQVINVYMLSPAGTSRSPTTPFTSQQIVGPALARPSPVVRASPEGLTTSPQIQLSTHGRVIQAIRTPTRIFVPNLAAAANRPSQVRSPVTPGPTASSSPCLHRLLSTPPSEPLQKPATAPPNTPVEASVSRNETSLHSAESPAETQNTPVVVQAANTNNSTANVYPAISTSSSESTDTVQVMQVRNMSPQNTKYLIILPQKANQEANSVGRVSTAVMVTDNRPVSAAVSETSGLPTNIETVSAASETTQKNPDAIQVLQV